MNRRHVETWEAFVGLPSPRRQPETRGSRPRWNACTALWRRCSLSWARRRFELAALADQLAVAEAKAAAAQLRTAAVEAELPSGMTRQERIEMARRMAPTAGRFRGAILAALNRSKGWELTEAEYYRLVDAPCHYGGGPTPSHGRRSGPRTAPSGNQET